MANKRTTVVPDMHAPEEACPHCGQPFTPVEYYTARRIALDSQRVSDQTIRLETVYQDLTAHRGGLCRRCIRYNRRQRAKRWLILAALGLILLAICASMARESIQHRDELLMKVAVGMGVAGLSALLAGLITALCLRRYDDTSPKPYPYLYALLLKQLQAEHFRRKTLTYMTVDEAKQLIPRLSPNP